MQKLVEISVGISNKMHSCWAIYNNFFLFIILGLSNPVASRSIDFSREPNVSIVFFSEVGKERNLFCVLKELECRGLC
jgi:hypothetical protein